MHLKVCYEFWPAIVFLTARSETNKFWRLLTLRGARSATWRILLGSGSAVPVNRYWRRQQHPVHQRHGDRQCSRPSPSRRRAGRIPRVVCPGRQRARSSRPGGSPGGSSGLARRWIQQWLDFDKTGKAPAPNMPSIMTVVSTWSCRDFGSSLIQPESVTTVGPQYGADISVLAFTTGVGTALERHNGLVQPDDFRDGRSSVTTRNRVTGAKRSMVPTSFELLADRGCPNPVFASSTETVGNPDSAVPVIRANMHEPGGFIPGASGRTTPTTTTISSSPPFQAVFAPRHRRRPALAFPNLLTGACRPLRW